MRAENTRVKRSEPLESRRRRLLEELRTLLAGVTGDGGLRRGHHVSLLLDPRPDRERDTVDFLLTLLPASGGPAAAADVACVLFRREPTLRCWAPVRAGVTNQRGSWHVGEMSPASYSLCLRDSVVVLEREELVGSSTAENREETGAVIESRRVMRWSVDKTLRCAVVREGASVESVEIEVEATLPSVGRWAVECVSAPWDPASVSPDEPPAITVRAELGERGASGLHRARLSIGEPAGLPLTHGLWVHLAPADQATYVGRPEGDSLPMAAIVAPAVGAALGRGAVEVHRDQTRGAPKYSIVRDVRTEGLAPGIVMARRVRLSVDATAASLYYHLPESRYVLWGSDNWDGARSGPVRDFTVDDRCLRDGVWFGITSYAVRSGQVLRVPDTGTFEWHTTLDGLPITVRRDGRWFELLNPGPLLVVPVPLDGVVVGAIRVVRSKGRRPFSEADERRLLDDVPLVAMSIAQLHLRAALIRSNFEIAKAGSERELLEAIAQEAVALLRGEPKGAAIFLYDPRSRAYTFRAPEAALGSMDKDRYTAQDEGLTAEIIKKRRPLLSNNLRMDLAAGGTLAHIRHESKGAETPPASTQSWAGVPILSRVDPAYVVGVIRVSSLEPNAFSYQDVETLTAIAQQLDSLLQHRKSVERERYMLEATTNTSTRAIISCDEKGNIMVFNDAAEQVLVIKRQWVRNRSVIDHVYGGKEALARAVKRGILEAPDKPLRDWYTVFYTPIGVPIPVRLEASLLRDPQSGDPIGSVGIFEDMRTSPSTETIRRISGRNQEGLTVDKRIADALDRIVPRLGPPVLIKAEKGSGKQLLVNALHAVAQRAGEPVKVRCEGMLEPLLEVELFGAAAGGFVPGAPERPGVFERAAQGGTVYLDEIADLTENTQKKLINLIDDKCVKRIGGEAEISVDVQLIVSTNADLEACVESGRLLPDLVHRLRALEMTLPPLRERDADIMLLADHFLAHAGGGKTAPEGFSSEAIRALMTYDWPGNVRELREAIEMAVRQFLAEEPAGRAGKNSAEPRLILSRHFPHLVAQGAQSRPSGGNQVPGMRRFASSTIAISHSRPR